MNNISNRFPAHLPRQQRGAVLAVTMIMLMTMTVIGVAALSNTKMQENMAGNLQEQVRVFQAADGGVIRAWYEMDGKYDTQVTQFECTTIPTENYVEYDYSSTNSYANSLKGSAAYKYIGNSNSPGAQKASQGIQAGDSQQPVYYFVWRSRATGSASNAKSSVYMGVKLVGATSGSNVRVIGDDAVTNVPGADC